MGAARTEQHAIGHDHRRPSAHIERAQNQMQEEQFTLGGVRRQIGVDIALIHGAFEGRVHQNDIELARAVIALGQGVHIKELRRLNAVQHQVHRADAQHGHA